MVARQGNPAAASDPTPVDVAITVGRTLVPPNGRVDVLVDNLAAHRGRPISVVRLDLGVEGPTGAWVSTRDLDVLITSEAATPTQHEATVLHEVAHMLLGHEPDGVDEHYAHFASLVAPTLAPDLVRHVLTRHTYVSQPEHDAESLATRLAVAVRRARTEHHWADRVSTRMR